MDPWRDGEASILRLVEHELGGRLSRLDTSIAQAVIRQATAKFSADPSKHASQEAGLENVGGQSVLPSKPGAVRFTEACNLRGLNEGART